MTAVDPINSDNVKAEVANNAEKVLKGGFIGTQEEYAEFETTFVENIFHNFKNKLKKFNVNGSA